MKKRFKNLLCISLLLIIIAGVDLNRYNYTGIVTDTQIKTKKGAKSYTIAYYNVYVDVNNYGDITQFKISDKKIARNPSDYIGKEVRIKKTEFSWYGLFEDIDYKIIH